MTVHNSAHGGSSHILQEQDVGVLVGQQLELTGRMRHAAHVPACNSESHVSSIPHRGLWQKCESGVG